jgi:anhydro-N-acetylmuramic acid kinase
LSRVDRLRQKASKKRRLVAGLMSGTSVDAIDVALTEIVGYGQDAAVRLLAFESYPFPEEIRARVFRLFDPDNARIEEICHLDFLLGELFAEAVLQLLRAHQVDPQNVDLIGSAGQTIWHDPAPVRAEVDVAWVGRPIDTRSTLAIGQSAVIAERTGIITIGDLRVRDVAAGGQGAPLIAYADWVLLRHATLGRCVQNIGGIGNVTYLPPSARPDDVIAFDTGPGNMVIDALAEVATGGKEHFDRDGGIAARGRVRDDVLEEWLDDPYFRRPPPKTTGRERFGKQYARRLLTERHDLPIEDLVATATALTAHSIARAYDAFVAPRGAVDEVVIGGGGSRNPVLLAMLRSAIPGARVVTHEDLGIDSDAKEAIGIAIIANDSAMGIETNIPGATGAHPTVLGKISL